MTDISNRDYVLILDKTGSMAEKDCAGGKSRWDYMQETVFAFSSFLEQHDPDGIDVYFFNRTFTKHEGVTSAKIKEIFAANQPSGPTYFAPALEEALKKFFNGDRATTIFVVTDGEAYDKDETKKLIIDAANRIVADEALAISFIQVGKDAGATKFLKSLDDDLQKAGAKFDIVDTMTIEDLEDKNLVDVLIAAIND